MTRFLNPLLLLTCTLLSLIEAKRSTVSVSFEYQLEVADIVKTGSTQDVLNMIDEEILGELQSNLPTISGSTGKFLVEFASIDSDIYTACFTENDQCSLVRSTVVVSYEGDKPVHSVEFVTLQFIQDYLEAKTKDESNQIFALYTYPSYVTSLAKFQLLLVDDRMTEAEIQVLEETFEEVFGAIIFAIEGDTEVVDAVFLYQDLYEIDDVFAQGGYLLSTDMQVAGYCRDCLQTQFEKIVVNVILENMSAFQNKLVLNSNAVGSTYFDAVRSISFQVPELPTTLPPVEDESIFDEEPPVVKNKQPWFLWFGISLVFCVLGLGGFFISREWDEEYEKNENFSTSESEGEDSEDISANHGGVDGEGDGYQVETVAQTEDGTTASNYEVYVF